MRSQYLSRRVFATAATVLVALSAAMILYALFDKSSRLFMLAGWVLLVFPLMLVVLGLRIENLPKRTNSGARLCPFCNHSTEGLPTESPCPECGEHAADEHKEP
ncbi:MAG: hypothetical protein SFY69_10140 [Planctomycetota bacterium]|nr:hypothetical protein [Planctomycetota bacterium]